MHSTADSRSNDVQLRVYSPIVHAIKLFYSKMSKEMAGNSLNVKDFRRRVNRFEEVLIHIEREQEDRPTVWSRLRFEVRLNSALASDSELDFDELVRCVQSASQCCCCCTPPSGTDSLLRRAGDVFFLSETGLFSLRTQSSPAYGRCSAAAG